MTTYYLLRDEGHKSPVFDSYNDVSAVCYIEMLIAVYQLHPGPHTTALTLYDDAQTRVVKCWSPDEMTALIARAQGGEV